jgi:hypothetical protein
MVERTAVTLHYSKLNPALKEFNGTFKLKRSSMHPNVDLTKLKKQSLHFMMSALISGVHQVFVKLQTKTILQTCYYLFA